MTRGKKSINSLIRDELTGNISDKDKKKLHSWIEESQENKKKYIKFMSRTDFVNRYEDYSRIDENVAWRKFRKKNLFNPHFHWNRISRYAAIFLLPIAGVLVALWLLNNKNSQSFISNETRIAMIRSEQMGRQRATLVLSDGMKIDLVNRLDVSLQSLNRQELDPSGSNVDDADNELKTHEDSEYWLTLEDGSSVHLNYNSILRFPSKFSSTDRTVYLDGEAYFLVSKENKRPFRIITTAGIVTEYGTSFNVNTYTEGITKVTLVEGSIGVTPKLGKEQMMEPGQMAILDANLSTVNLKKVDIESYVAWNTGRFVFEDYPLENLMDVISKWYGKKVIFETDNIRKLSFTGDIDRYSSIQPVLNAIQRTTSLDITLSEEYIILRKPQ